MRIVSRQMVNLWGRSNGEVDEFVALSLVPETDSPIANIHIERTSRINSIPDHADVTIILTYNLIVLRQRIGSKAECVLHNTTWDERALSLAAQHHMEQDRNQQCGYIFVAPVALASLHALCLLLGSPQPTLSCIIRHPTFTT